MIDLRRLREDANYRAGALHKGASDDAIDALLAADDSARSVRSATEERRAAQNAASKEIGRAKPEERQAKIDAVSGLKAELTALEAELTDAEEAVRALSLTIPNPAHESVPGGGEDDYRVEHHVGEQTPAPAETHAEIGERLGLVDSERAVRMSGSRFAYVMGDAVRLQFGLVQFLLNKLVAKSFVPVIPPVLVREEMMIDAGFFPTDRNQVYELEKDQLFLAGTAEVGLAGIHRGERLEEGELPRRYVGYSSCFRREAGTYGKDTQGLFRVHQFDKVEMFVYADPATSWDELENLREIEEEIFTELEIPYRVITPASGDLGAAAAKKYDIEAWLPSEQRFREVTSCSNYTDYSARRMGTRIKTDSGTQFAHTLNGTACAIGRTMLMIFENHQQADGSILIPEVLRPFCGLDVIGAS